MNYIQVEFEIENAASNEILIALLSQSGFESFEERENSLIAFIKEDGFIEDSLGDVLQIVPVNYAITVVPQQNWNAQWESSFEPIVVNDFVAIRAGFHQPIKNVKHEIIITPKMSFGTGHHATTYLMIEQMAALDFKDKSVLDFGTGTAVLSILAEKMGAANIDAIDNDDWSIENAKENIETNNCNRITLEKADSISSTKKYDIILANINLNVILANLPAISSASKKGTKILLSGFLKTDEEVLLEKLSKIKATHSSTLQKGEWICLLCQMN